ncbi:MAG: hypothetical protein WAW39_15990 [Prosthecobacter sp.]|uniref:hypothetical protein n=1 Tax=Prosthecobacter sp. TaxID=1965333 RepID=UPI003BB015DC
MITLANLPIPEAMDFWKWIVSAWAAYSMYAKYVETQAHKQRMKSGSKEEPFNIGQPVMVKESISHAEKPELDKLSAAVVALTQTVNVNHTNNLLAGSERESSIKDLLRHEVSAVTRELSAFKDSLHKELTLIRERIASAETRLDQSDS